MIPFLERKDLLRWEVSAIAGFHFKSCRGFQRILKQLRTSSNSQTKCVALVREGETFIRAIEAVRNTLSASWL